jgi:hypothetical protein
MNKDNWEKAENGICPICNTKSLREYKNFVTCNNCCGTPMECCGQFVTLITDPHPDEISFCPRCGEETLLSNGHALFMVKLK